MECGCEAAAFNKLKKEGGSFAAALQSALRRVYCEKYPIENKLFTHSGIRDY
jgi:hypothetical protein